MSKNQGDISQANVPHIAVPRDYEKDSVFSFPSITDSSQNRSEESTSSFPSSTDSSRSSTEESSSSFPATTDSSENTSNESMSKKQANLEGQDSTTMYKIQEMRSPKTSTSSEHHKNMKKYYKKKENQIKLKIRLEKYMLEMKLLEIKIKDLSSYLDICVCENKEECDGVH
jgi:hypothetical protein